MKSNFDVPQLKSFELVSSLSKENDDSIQKKNSQKDCHVDLTGTTLKNYKCLHMKEDGRNNELKLDTTCEYTLKPHSSSLPQKMKHSMLEEDLGSNDKLDFDKYNKEELNAIGTYKIRGVKGVKEDCERFRLQMKILKEKANHSRMREVMVEGLVENQHKNSKEEIVEMNMMEDVSNILENDHANSKIKSTFQNPLISIYNLNKERKNLRTRGGIEINKKNDKGFFATPASKEILDSQSSCVFTFEGENQCQNNAQEDFKARKRIKTYNSALSNSTSSSSSTSSSVSTLSSLPLSHYVQKLKCLAPISHCPSNSFTHVGRNILKNQQNAHLNTKSFIKGSQPLNTYKQNPSLVTEEETKIDEEYCEMEVDMNFKNHLNNECCDFNGNTPLPIPTSHVESNTGSGIYSYQRAKKTIFASFKSDNKINNGDKIKKKVGNIMIANCNSPKDNQHSNKKNLEPCGCNNAIIFQKSKRHFNEDNKQIKYDGDSSGDFSQQIMFNKLKGLIESYHIQIDAKNKIMKTCFEDLEKKWDYSKDKMFKEILEARHMLQNNIKLKLEDTINVFMKKNEDNDEHILSMVEKKIERNQLQSDVGILALKSEMKHLWNEVKDLSQRKVNIQSCIDNFIDAIEKSKLEVNSEQKLLKNENNALMKQLQKIKQSDMQAEMESIRKLVEKVQENNVELERTQSIAHMEGMQERMLIMERVESLSKLYLGGLEEIRSNVSNIKINCRDRVDEIEDQLAEFRCQQKCYGTQSHSNLTHEMLMNELENIRTEVADIVEAERDHVQETLERENVNLQRQLIAICATNKREILNSMKGDLNKCFQSAQNKVLLMTDALKQKMGNLQCEIKEIQEGVEGFSKATSMIECSTKVASKAATKATICATKAKDMLNDLQKSFENEISNVQHTCLQLQENLKSKKDMVQSVANEARKISEELAREKEQMWLVASSARAKNLELNELIQKECLNIVEAVAIVKNERDVASHAAKEARCLALKAGEVLSEISEYFNRQMVKVQHMSMQLKEGIEQEKQGIIKEREIALKHNQESLNQYDEELELAIETWKRAMNGEIVKAMEVTLGLEEEQQRASIALEHVAMLSIQPNCIQVDMEEYISKTQYTLDKFSQSIQKIQVEQEDYHQVLLIKRQELEQFKNSWQIELSQLQQIVRILEKKLKESSHEQSIVGKRVGMVENIQVNLVQSLENVRNITGDLEKTAAIWLPKYETAARIVNELSSKVKCMDEQFQCICGGENLIQKIAHIAEAKVNGIKDMMINSCFKNIDIEEKKLLEKIENKNSANCHAISLLENRVNILENSPTHDSNMTSKLEYAEKHGKASDKSGNTSLVGHLNQTIETLQRKMEIIASKLNDMVTSHSNQDSKSRVLELESRIEHVALATFTNLKLLDKKVEHVTGGIQSALDGATMADKKCAALGFELVKVFRMFTCKHPRQCQKNSNHPKGWKELKISQSSFKKHDPNENLDSDFQNQATIEESTKIHQNTSRMIDNLQPIFSIVNVDISPKKITKKGLHNLTREPIIQSFDCKQSNSQYELEQECKDFFDFKEEEFFSQNRKDCFLNPLKNKECKSHGPSNKANEDNTPSNTNLEGQLTVEKYQEGFVKNCQRTNIHLEAGRIHVNVSHRSRGLNQLQKKNDLIAVQS